MHYQIAKQRRQAVVVLGMHRSGTSAVAGAAVRLGLAEPRTPLPTSKDNPAGFYESRQVVDRNYILLKRLGCAWNQCLWLDLAGLATANAAIGDPSLQRILLHEFADAPIFLLKDPRLCLTLSVWLDALQACDVSPSALIVCRHPSEVAYSLKLRNGLPEHESGANWLYYMLEAEHISRVMPRAVLFYDDVLTDWRNCLTKAGVTAQIDWPRPITASGQDIDQFLAPSLRHFGSAHRDLSACTPLVGELIQEAWQALRMLRDDPDSARARKSLDQVRQRFAIWRRVVYPPGTRVVWPPDQ